MNIMEEWKRGVKLHMISILNESLHRENLRDLQENSKWNNPLKEI